MAELKTSDHLRQGLGKLLDQYDERSRADQAREQKAKDDDAAFLSRFAALRREVVLPVFEEAGRLLAERGHEFSISETEFAGGGGNGLTEAGITLHLSPKG